MADTNTKRNKVDDHLVVGPELYKYVLDTSLREADVLKRLRLETYTALANDAIMLAAPDEAQFLAMLVKLIGAKRCLEVGVFTGYTTLALAMALPKDGKIIACDVSEEFTSIGKKYWSEAGVQDIINLRLGPAVETLQELIDNGEENTWDLAFIDADKPNYPIYYEQLLKLIRPNGVIVVDNTLWGGRVADPTANDESTSALRNLNAKVHADERVDVSMLHIADGVTLLRKRE